MNRFLSVSLYINSGFTEVVPPGRGGWESLVPSSAAITKVTHSHAVECKLKTNRTTCFFFFVGGLF